MKRFIKNIGRTVQIISNILVRIITFVFYFIFITPFGVFVILCRDYLKIKEKPCWESKKDISDVGHFLKQQ